MVSGLTLTHDFKELIAHKLIKGGLGAPVPSDLGEQHRAVLRLVALRLEAREVGEPCGLLAGDAATLERAERRGPSQGEEEQSLSELLAV